MGIQLAQLWLWWKSLVHRRHVLLLVLQRLLHTLEGNQLGLGTLQCLLQCQHVCSLPLLLLAQGAQQLAGLQAHRIKLVLAGRGRCGTAT